MLAKKLAIKDGHSVAVIGAPDTIDLVLPPGVSPSEKGAADVVLLYTKNRAALTKAVSGAKKCVKDGGVLWVAYPKAGQLGTDLSRDSLARAMQAEGLEPVAQVAVDDVWSALRFKRDAALSAARKKRGTFAAKKKAAPKKKAAAPKKKAAKK